METVTLVHVHILIQTLFRVRCAAATGLPSCLLPLLLVRLHIPNHPVAFTAGGRRVVMLRPDHGRGHTSTRRSSCPARRVMRFLSSLVLFFAVTRASSLHVAKCCLFLTSRLYFVILTSDLL